MKKKLRYFSDSDNFGGIKNMDKEFLCMLDIARHAIRQACIVHCGYDTTPGHVETSRHFALPCDASDFHYSTKIQKYKVEAEEMEQMHKNLDRLILKQVPRTIFEIMIIHRLAGIKRIGIYPFGKPRTYFHNDNTLNNKVDFWIGLQVDGIFGKLKKYFPEFQDDINALYNKFKASKKHKKIVYISPF